MPKPKWGKKVLPSKKRVYKALQILHEYGTVKALSGDNFLTPHIETVKKVCFAYIDGILRRSNGR